MEFGIADQGISGAQTAKPSHRKAMQSNGLKSARFFELRMKQDHRPAFTLSKDLFA